MVERTKGPRFYTTEKTTKQLLAEIIGMLSEYDADAINIQRAGGEPKSIAFLRCGVPYQIEPSVAGVAKRLAELGIKTRAPAAAVAWAQARALLELQLEAIENGIATAETILGGYALLATGQTVGDAITEKAELLGGRLLMPGGSK